MSTILGASASLLIRAGAYALIAFLILLMISIAATADTISVTPTGPAPAVAAQAVPTITLWFQGVAMVAIIVVIAVLVWRASMLDLWLHSRLDLHGMAAALMHDEMVKRGMAIPAAPVAPATPEPTLEDDPWVAEANKVAPPPPPAPRRVTPSTKAVAQTFSARRNRGEKMQ